MMNLLIDNHPYHYEMENLLRAFFYDKKITVLHDATPTDEPYVLTAVHDKIAVTVSIDGDARTLTAERGEDDELTMAQLMYRLLSDMTRRELPWGVLTGVRPIKLFSNLTATMGESGAEAYFEHSLLVSPDKIRLSREVSLAQRQIIARSGKRSFSLYISIPFCPTRCNYCSFVSQSIERAKKLIDPYFELLLEEIAATAYIAAALDLHLESVYVGGGTPTTLNAEQLSRLIAAVRAHFDLSGCSELTVEAGRPDTVTEAKLHALKEGGVTRISINPQTFNDAVLETIGRRHTAAQTLDAFRLARELGFDNINMDLIAGLAGDTPISFNRSLDTACALDPESITVHTLAMKRSSRLNWSDVSEGFDSTKSMLDYAGERLHAFGYIPYYLYRQSGMLSNLENIGWAKEGYFSPYNIYIMEESHSILACGAGGVTKLRDTASNHIERIFNFKFPYEYISRFDELIARKARISAFYSEYNQV